MNHQVECLFLSVILCTVYVPLAAHAPITAHQSFFFFQFEIYGIINRPLKSSHS